MFWWQHLLLGLLEQRVGQVSAETATAATTTTTMTTTETTSNPVTVVAGCVVAKQLGQVSGSGESCSQLRACQRAAAGLPARPFVCVVRLRFGCVVFVSQKRLNFAANIAAVPLAGQKSTAGQLRFILLLVGAKRRFLFQSKPVAL